MNRVETGDCKMRFNLNNRMTERQFKVLRALVSEYVTSGQPVGSQALVNHYELDISPATVRKEMSILEQIGFLASPHTSAGRIPTDEAIYIYVSELISVLEITISQKHQLEDFYHKAKLQLDHLLHETARMLAASSNYAGIVLSPVSTGSTIRRIELVSILENLVLLVMVSESGTVYQKQLRLERSVTQEDLYKISKFLNNEIKGYELSDLQHQGLGFMSEAQPHLGDLAEIAVFVVQSLVYTPPDQAVYVEGQNRLYRDIMEQFGSNYSTEVVLSKLQDRNYLCELLNRLKKPSEVAVQVGLEVDEVHLEGVSVLTRGYSVGGRNLGALGVIGMRRMPYDKIVPTLDYSSQILTNVFNDRVESSDGAVSTVNVEKLIEANSNYLIKKFEGGI